MDQDLSRPILIQLKEVFRPQNKTFTKDKEKLSWESDLQTHEWILVIYLESTVSIPYFQRRKNDKLNFAPRK